jgi:hypothetical protein
MRNENINLTENSQSRKARVSGSVVLKTNAWEHNCADGCCHTYGTDVWINNTKVTQGDFDSIQSILKEVLESLGYNVEFL